MIWYVLALASLLQVIYEWNTIRSGELTEFVKFDQIRIKCHIVCLFIRSNFISVFARVFSIHLLNLCFWARAFRLLSILEFRLELKVPFTAISQLFKNILACPVSLFLLSFRILAEDAVFEYLKPKLPCKTKFRLSKPKIFETLNSLS